MKICDIFKSIQGESTYAGLPCAFVRFTGCNLHCYYCDTPYAKEEGKEWSLKAVLDKIETLDCRLVEITGGEPLLQREAVGQLIDKLLEHDHEVLLETNGSISISWLNERVVKIMDVKCPGSGMSEHVCWENLEVLGKQDEVKFVILDRDDYEWTKTVLGKFTLPSRVKVLLSPVFGKLMPSQLAEWILADRLPVRLQLQWHRYIWPGSFTRFF